MITQAIFLENLCKLFTISKRKIVPLHNDNDSAIKELLQSRRKRDRNKHKIRYKLKMRTVYESSVKDRKGKKF